MTYKNGLSFSEILAVNNIDKLIERVEGKKAALIIIDGGLGEGKTTLMIHILDYINKSKGLPPINIDGPQLSMGGSDFLKKMRECHEKDYPCIGYDEAGDFSRRGSLTHFNAMMNRTFDTFRAFKCIVVICLPNFSILDQQIFDNQIPRLLLHLKNRSKAQGNFYGFSLYRMQLLRHRMKKMPIKNYAFATVQPNFVGHFQDLTSERSKELDKLSTKNKLDILKKSEIKIDGLLTYPEMATKLMRSIEWTRKACKILKLVPDRTIGSVKYFGPKSLDILSEHLDKVNESTKGRPFKYFGPKEK